MTTWRVGRHLGRTIYVQVGDEPSDDDHLMGMMDTRELAQLVVDAVNGRDQLRAKVEADRAELSRRMGDRSDPYWSVDQVDQWSAERVALNRVLAMLDSA